MVDRTGEGVSPWWGILREIEEDDIVPSAPVLADADPDERIWANVGYRSEDDSEGDGTPLGRQIAVESAERVVEDFDFGALILEMVAEDAKQLRDRPGIKYVKRSPYEPDRIREDRGEFEWGKSGLSEGTSHGNSDDSSSNHQFEQLHTGAQPVKRTLDGR